MTRFAAIAATLALLASPALATEIFEAEGNWLGEGQLATGPTAPLEHGRCRVEIKPQAGNADVSIIGSCAVAGGLSDISMRVVRSGGGAVNAGFWSAATGQTVQYRGRETAEMIEMESSTDLVLDDVIYESRVSVAAPGPGAFSIRQFLRAEGESAWRLVVDMSYRPAGG